MALATATPIAMIAPMNDCTFSVVRVTASINTTPIEHRRHGRDDDEGEPQRLKVRGEQQKDDDDGDDEPGGDVREGLAHRADLAAHGDGRTARRRAGPRDRRVDLADGSSQILAGDVRRQRDHALTVDAIVFADDRRVLDRRDVAEQRVRAALAAHRHDAQIVERRSSVVAAPRSGPGTRCRCAGRPSSSARRTGWTRSPRQTIARPDRR